MLTEAAVDEDATTTNVNDEGNVVDMTLSDEEFIDDSVIEHSVTDYYGFTYVSRNYADAIQDSFSDFDFDQEANNYCDDDDLQNFEIDELKDYKSRVDKFAKTYLIHKVLTMNIRFFILSSLR